MSIVIDLGGGITGRLLHGTKVWGGADNEAGIIVVHTKPETNDPCAAPVFWVPWYHPKPMWHLVSREPLTLEPSIQCACGFHGHIRDGKWVSV